MFNNLLKAIDARFDGEKIDDQAFDDLVNHAETFNDWRNIFYRAEPGSVFERMVFLQMAILAKTFGQWLNVYQEAEEHDEVKTIAMNQLIKLADDPLDGKNKDALKLPRWQKIFEIAPCGQVQHNALIKITKLMMEKKIQLVRKKRKDNSLSKI